MDSKSLSKKREKALGYLMGRAHRTMALQFHKALDNANLEITPEQWVLLVNLWIKDGQNQQELANNVFKDKGSITRSLNSMEAQNLLVRIEDVSDRRNKLIYLTKKGKDMKDISFPIVWNCHDKALEGISEKEIEICGKVLTQIYENLAFATEINVDDATIKK